ncbi:YhdH/YhfP family quinone oxidoreductase [Gilvimarinus chinensis]|uniref:YhdH/YhfP family quinone oxidoreductase n=1 Tax=Gilvimarinus chinensis TaxID=396005 RepID=UPI0003743283|nr:YhdH/YhfP family quinone oxidoreductase [Gilvimarinus chinensis]
MSDFSSVRVHRSKNGQVSCVLENVAESTLGDRGVLIDVYYSGLNFKDALSSAANPGVSRNFPHTPGIDAAGIVRDDPSGTFKAGQRVLVSGYDFGMNTPGGLTQVCRAPVEWVCECPESLSLADAMIYGTPGLTVAQGLDKIKRLQRAEIDGETFVITGASGAVGNLAIILASYSGCKVIALSGKAQLYPRLRELGASECMPSSEWLEPQKKALLKPSWRLGFDTLGGDALVNLLKATDHEGAIVSCGLALSADLTANVYPFILRGVSLLGVDSAEQPLSYKHRLWQQLAEVPLTQKVKDAMVREISLAQVPDYLSAMLKGQGQGRVLVKTR